MICDHEIGLYPGKRVLIMGLGSFGGGVAVTSFFASRHAQVTVTDERAADQLVDSLASLKQFTSIQYRLGGHSVDDVLASDLIVVNPAIRPDHPLLNLAADAGIPRTSESNLFWQLNPAPIVAVTGSNGKSTTTAIVHSILSQGRRRCWLGGNIGISLLPNIEMISSEDIVVLELSSFQLSDLDRLQVSPHVAVVTNFTPNHLDWHNGIEDYRRAKQTILRWQSPSDFGVMNCDDVDVCQWKTNGLRFNYGLDRGNITEAQAGVFVDGDCLIVRMNDREQHLPIQKWLKLPGRHNLSNAAAAICASILMGATFEQIKVGIESFRALPHRLQFVGEVNQRGFFNDSVATTPESTLVAIDSFDQPMVLMAGGYDKQIDLSQLATAIATKVKAVSLMGQTAGILRELILKNSHNQCEVSVPMKSFQEACRWAYEHSSSGDVILLSPGCASYDWFRNFQDRGSQFEGFVSQLMKSSDQTSRGKDCFDGDVTGI